MDLVASRNGVVCVMPRKDGKELVSIRGKTNSLAEAVHGSGCEVHIRFQWAVPKDGVDERSVQTAKELGLRRQNMVRPVRQNFSVCRIPR